MVVLGVIDSAWDFDMVFIWLVTTLCDSVVGLLLSTFLAFLNRNLCPRSLFLGKESRKSEEGKEAN